MTGNEEKRMWGIHTKDDGLFLNDNKIAIGWHEFWDLGKLEANQVALYQLGSMLTLFEVKDFVANLLNAMEYRTRVSQHGGDGGIDIVAYKGEGELPPRIVVQVKSQDGNITEDVIRALKGAIQPGDYGLFVTL